MTDMLQAYVDSRTSTNTMFDVFCYVLMAVGMWKMFEKAHQPGWMGLIPLLNVYKLCEIAWGNGFYIFLLLIPGINFIALGFLSVNIARAFGKSNAYAVGLFFIPPVFYTMLGLGSAQYYGPRGLGANAGTQTGFGGTYNRRSSGTVDFNVEKAEPENEYQNAQTVDFDVEQNDK